MKIQITTSGYCFDQGKATQRSGACTMLHYEDEHGFKARRTISFPAGNTTKNLADINAAILGLSSVKKSYRKDASVTLITTKQVASLLECDESGAFVRNSSKYKDELDRLRQWFSFYNDISVESGDLSDCAAEAKKCADDQKPKDTRTELYAGT